MKPLLLIVDVVWHDQTVCGFNCAVVSVFNIHTKPSLNPLRVLVKPTYEKRITVI